MAIENTLTTLFLEASEKMATHGSAIAIIASNALNEAAYKRIIKPAHTVAQCRQLKHTYRQSTSTLVALIEDLEPHIHWTDTGSGVKPKEVQERLAYVELIGPTGMVMNDNCRIGLFFQAQNTDYPNHRHAAEELYMVLSGHAMWSKESDPTFRKKAPTEFTHHKSWEPHAMQTTTEPLLAMWCWTGDIGFEHYEMV